MLRKRKSTKGHTPTRSPHHDQQKLAGIAFQEQGGGEQGQAAEQAGQAGRGRPARLRL